MLVAIFLTFLLTTSLYLFLAWLACRRLTSHLQGNTEATRAVADHILLPLFGRKEKPLSDEATPDDLTLEKKIERVSGF